MKTLTRDEYKNLLNEVGIVAKFYIECIEDIKYNPDFSEAFKRINKNKDVKINDKDNFYSTPCRLIDRDNETIYLVKNTRSLNQEYEDILVYFLTVDFNKKIKMYIDYNMITKNEINNNEIYFEILENYEHTECGDIYGDGRVVNNREEGYKGCIFTQNNECVLEYGKYEYNNLTVIYPDEIYNSDNTIPELKDLNKEVVIYKLTTGVHNPVYLAQNETQIKRINARQRIR